MKEDKESMDNGIYVLAHSIDQIHRQNTIRSNNMVNQKTPGFLADVPYQIRADLVGSGFETRTYSAMSESFVDFKPGTLVHTGRALDVALSTPGFIAVQDEQGNEAYTRAGRFQLNALGQLLTANGHPVLGNGGNIVIPENNGLYFSDDGSLNIQTSDNIAVVDRLKLVNPDQSTLYKNQNGLLYVRGLNNNALPPDANVRVRPGFIEKSNVDSMSQLMEISANASKHQQLVKLFQTFRELDDESTSTLLGRQ